MNDRAFDAPIYIRTGEHLIQEIITLDDALDFLEEWPSNLQGPIYQTALQACQRAYSRAVPLDTARNAFAGFAKSARILENVDGPLPLGAIASMGRGGPPG